MSEPAPPAGPFLGPRAFDLRGRRAVVTGASSGIGRATALALAAAGAHVLVHARRSAAAADDVAAACRKCGVESAVLLADLAEPAARAQLVERAEAAFGPADIWVHQAGADVLTGDGARLDAAAKLDLLWRVDVLGAIEATRAAGARMRARGGGAIVTMGWDQAETGMEGESGESFAAVKGAVMAFTRSLARSLAPVVRVNGVAPGWIRTAWGETAPAAWQERAVREAPLARWGTPQDVAAAILYLVSPAADFVTGQILRVGGGAVR